MDNILSDVLVQVFIRLRPSDMRSTFRVCRRWAAQYRNEMLWVLLSEITCCQRTKKVHNKIGDHYILSYEHTLGAPVNIRGDCTGFEYREFLRWSLPTGFGYGHEFPQQFTTDNAFRFHNVTPFQMEIPEVWCNGIPFWGGNDISFFNAQISRLPRRITKLPYTCYNLSCNRFAEFPSVLQVSHITAIALSYNLLTEFPRLDMPNLWTISLDHNMIAEFPDIGGLPSLKNLEIRNNHIVTADVSLAHSRSAFVNIKLDGNPTERIAITGAPVHTWVTYSGGEVVPSPNVEYVLNSRE